MARIPEYDAPDRQVVASDKGANAFEQAGRRVGPAYNEAATLQRQAGEARAATIRQRRWPFDILELERSLEESSTTGGSKKTGLAVNVSGDINHLEHEKEGGGSGSSKEKADKPASSRSRLGNDVGATSMAAGALGRLASRLGGTGQYHNSQIDTATGLDMNLLKPVEAKQLVNGVLVPSSKAASFGDKADINGEKRAQTWSRTDWNNVDWNDPKNAGALQDYINKNGGADPWGHIQDRSVSTGGSGTDNRYISDSPSSGLDKGDMTGTVTARGTSGGGDFWSDITNSLGGVLDAAVSGNWPGGGKDYGGGVDTNDYTDLSGESGARDLSGER